MRLLLWLLTVPSVLCAEPGVVEKPFGTLPDGSAVKAFTLTGPTGMTATVMEYGAILTELVVRDAQGKPGDVVLGFATLEPYVKGHPYFGANVGRVANRIAKGKFTLDGKQYTLATNNAPNSLHGGKIGFDKLLWKGTIADAKKPEVSFTLTSKDGDEGYPGTLKITLTYTLTAENGLLLNYTATTDKPTPVNLAHHSYFNLAGEGTGTILDHTLELDCDRFTPTDDTLIPTGKIASVKNSIYDFMTPKPIGQDIGQTTGGYDLNFVKRESKVKPRGPREIAKVTDPKSGRVMTVYTDQPGVQFYTGNFLDGTLLGKAGKPYVKNGAFCLEPQHYPDTPNQPTFPSITLAPGAEYRQTSEYRFGVVGK